MMDVSPIVKDAGRSFVLSEDPDWTPPTHWVRAVQLAQRRAPCYRTDDRFQCAAQDCEWRRSCLKLVAVWRR
ncbi:hypothetical protein [Methylocaldum sp.]|uniref:hypothetical protein n=1 Tax=Methylocaldum sp. TaxID=1969727 RepID=UPI002D475FF1|nr:hypothetical protein [Methylocaldum sp.]HYE35925.1 hypothetical protein [Methylocaldum sp.]